MPIKRTIKLSLDQVEDACREYVVNHRLLPNGQWSTAEGVKFDANVNVQGLQGIVMQVRGVEVECTLIEQPKPQPEPQQMPQPKPEKPDPSKLN